MFFDTRSTDITALSILSDDIFSKYTLRLNIPQLIIFKLFIDYAENLLNEGMHCYELTFELSNCHLDKLKDLIRRKYNINLDGTLYFSLEKDFKHLEGILSSLQINITDTISGLVKLGLLTESRKDGHIIFNHIDVNSFVDEIYNDHIARIIKREKFNCFVDGIITVLNLKNSKTLLKSKLRLRYFDNYKKQDEFLTLLVSNYDHRKDYSICLSETIKDITLNIFRKN